MSWKWGLVGLKWRLWWNASHLMGTTSLRICSHCIDFFPKLFHQMVDDDDLSQWHIKGLLIFFFNCIIFCHTYVPCFIHENSQSFLENLNLSNRSSRSFPAWLLFLVSGKVDMGRLGHVLFLFVQVTGHLSQGGGQ